MNRSAVGIVVRRVDAVERSARRCSPALHLVDERARRPRHRPASAATDGRDRACVPTLPSSALSASTTSARRSSWTPHTTSDSPRCRQRSAAAASSAAVEPGLVDERARLRCRWRCATRATAAPSATRPRSDGAMAHADVGIAAGQRHARLELDVPRHRFRRLGPPARAYSRVNSTGDSHVPRKSASIPTIVRARVETVVREAVDAERGLRGAPRAPRTTPAS